MLQYRNCPEQDTKVPFAMIVFGKAKKDFILILPGKEQTLSSWTDIRNDREIALSKHNMKISRRLTEHTNIFPELAVGDNVRIQNQVGPNQLRWEELEWLKFTNTTNM